MFKKILLLLVLIPFFGISQFLPTKIPQKRLERRVQFTGTVQADSIKKGALFINSLKWFKKHFKSDKDIIQGQDSVNGYLICKATLKASRKGKAVKDDGICFVSIVIRSKDGSYTYEFAEIKYEYPGGIALHYSGFEPTGKEEVDAEVKTLVESLKRMMVMKG